MTPSATPENYTTLTDVTAFGNAKQLSDFLGMLVRLTFSIAFVRY
jgi:hypothetical protein